MAKKTARKIKKPGTRTGARANAKHPTATYPRAKLKLPKGVDPSRKRAAPRGRKNPVGDAIGRNEVRYGMLVSVKSEHSRDNAPRWKIAKIGNGFVVITMASKSGAMSVYKDFRYKWDGAAYSAGGKSHPSYLVHPDLDYYKRAAGEENPDAVAPVAQPVAPPPAPPSPASVPAATAPRVEPTAPAAAQKNPSMLGWTDRGGGVFTTLASITFEDARGITRYGVFPLRVDGRRGSYRVDVSDSGMWVAIDGGKRFKTEKSAKAFAAKWVKAAIAQRSLNPVLDKPNPDYGPLFDPIRHSAAASLAAERYERQAAKKRAAAKAAKGKKNAGAQKPAAKQPKPSRPLAAYDFTRVTQIFTKYRELFAKKYPNVLAAKLVVDPKIHDSARHFARTYLPTPAADAVVSIAPELADESVVVQTGIIIHELAHAVYLLGYLPEVKGYDANERATDRLAEKVTGMKIYYDKRGVEVAGSRNWRPFGGRRPRPDGLR